MTMRTSLLFLYGTGARVHEAIGLRLSDLDLKQKFVGLREPERNPKWDNPTLPNTLDLYVQSSAPRRSDLDRVFVTCNRKPQRRNTRRYNFVRLCARANIQQANIHSPTPGMHDLRHTFAVHCLEAWVRQGNDLRQKLPFLRATLAMPS
jgi:integrase